MSFLQHIYCTHLRCKLNQILFKWKRFPEPLTALRLKLKPLPVACNPSNLTCLPLPLAHSIPPALPSSSLSPIPTTSRPFPTQKCQACQKIPPSGIFPKLCLLLTLQVRARLLLLPGAAPTQTRSSAHFPSPSQASHLITLFSSFLELTAL